MALWDMRRQRQIIDTTLLTGYKVTSEKPGMLTLCRDVKGAIWAGTSSQIKWAQPQRPYHFQDFVDPRTGKTLKAVYVRALIPDSRSGIWAGSEDGLIRIVYNESLQRYETDPSIQHLDGITISDLYIDRRQQLWIATKGKGIARLDLAHPEHGLKWYNDTDGLCNNFICRIEGSHHDSILWISTHNGLSRFNPQSGIFHNFYEDSGFPGNEFNSAASASFPDGTLLFGGVTGLIQFHPDAIPAYDFQYQTILSSARIYDKHSGALSTIPLTPATELRLPPYPEYIEFQLGSTEFVMPEKMHFRYRLHGLSELWTNTSGEHDVKFIRLAPGSYSFEVQATHLDGHFGKPILIPLFVATPYYETWWFKAVLVAFIIGLAYGAYRYSLQQNLRAQQIRRQIADDLHDDIGNKLNIIGILVQKIVNGRSTPDPATAKNSDMVKLVEVSRNALRSLHTMIWSVDSEKDRLSILISRMQDFADDYLLPLNIPYRFDVMELLPDRDIDLAARYHTILIYQELLTNMVKYTNPTLITISLRLETDHTLRLVLTNDHFQTSDPSNSGVSGHRGLESIERRLSRINGKIIWTENSNTQQIITLLIPRIF
jgi:hypothetical protein